MRLYPFTRDMSEEYVHFDRTAFPYIKMTFTGEAANDESFDNYLDELKKNYDKKENIGLLFDAANAGLPTVKYQRKQARWMRKYDKMIKDYCVCIAYVVPQKVVRNTLKLIFKIYNNPVPYKVFENMEEGETWVRKQLGNKG